MFSKWKYLFYIHDSICAIKKQIKNERRKQNLSEKNIKAVLCEASHKVGKTVSCVNLGIGLAQEGKKVLLIDGNPQGSLTISLGYEEPDEMEYSLATLMMNIVNDEKLNKQFCNFSLFLRVLVKNLLLL